MPLNEMSTIVQIFCQDELKSSIKLLEDYKNGIVPAGITDRALWEAQKTKQVCTVLD